MIVDEPDQMALFFAQVIAWRRIDCKSSSQPFGEMLFFGFHFTVPMIFECVLGSSFQYFGDDGPAFAVSMNSQKKEPFLFGGPVALSDSSS